MTREDELQVIQKVIYKERNDFEILVFANHKKEVIAHEKLIAKSGLVRYIA